MICQKILKYFKVKAEARVGAETKGREVDNKVEVDEIKDKAEAKVDEVEHNVDVSVICQCQPIVSITFLSKLLRSFPRSVSE